MNDEPYGVIGMSAAFADYAAFARKVETYLSMTSDAGVIAVNDVHGIVRKRFSGGVKDSLSVSISLREKRDLIRRASFALFFWDGTGVNDFIYLAQLYRVPTKVVAVETTRVVNRDRGDDFDLYIGRGTPWGNPFAIGDKGADRSEVIEMYKEYFVRKFVEDPEGNRQIRTLKGKVLGCHCKPSACHGDVIANYLNSLPDE